MSYGVDGCVLGSWVVGGAGVCALVWFVLVGVCTGVKACLVDAHFTLAAWGAVVCCISFTEGACFLRRDLR